MDIQPACPVVFEDQRALGLGWDVRSPSLSWAEGIFPVDSNGSRVMREQWA